MPRRQDRRRVRRSHALPVVGLLLAAPLLSSCGFNERTNQPYTPGAGTNAVESDVDVLAAVVVATQEDSGTFIASLVNNSRDTGINFEGVAGANGTTIEPDEYAGVEIPPRELVNLADAGGPTFSGTFAPGDFVPLSLNFDNGDVVTMTVPVVPACGDYAGLDESVPPGGAEDPFPCPGEDAEGTTEDGGH